MAANQRGVYLDADNAEVHRAYGLDCSIGDNICLMVEYDRGKPVALICYAPSEQVFSVREKARLLTQLGIRANLPVVLAIHDEHFYGFQVTVLHPVGFPVAQPWPRKGAWLAESEFVKLLYRLRRREMPWKGFRTATPTSGNLYEYVQGSLHDFLTLHPGTGMTASQRHRLYGYNCPAVDIDLLLSSADSGNPAALIEFKRKFWAAVDQYDINVKVVRAVAEAAGLPYLLVAYLDIDTYHVHEGSDRWRTYTQIEYLYYLDGLRSNALLVSQAPPATAA